MRLPPDPPRRIGTGSYNGGVGTCLSELCGDMLIELFLKSKECSRGCNVTLKDCRSSGALREWFRFSINIMPRNAAG